MTVVVVVVTTVSLEPHHLTFCTASMAVSEGRGM